MKAFQIIAGMILMGIISFATQVRAQMPEMTPDHVMVNPAELTYAAGPPSLPPGVKAVVIEGDPAKAGLFTMRATIPANYKIPPHFHPADEHVTIIEGTAYMGIGDKLDEKAAKELEAGGYCMLKAGLHHYFYSKKGCTIQIHGMGPWGITYLNPADDPRNQK